MIDTKKGYIKNETVNLEISIEVADPNDENKSELTFENIGPGCEADCMRKFRLSVVNIGNLIAVRSPIFIMQKLPWNLTVFKSHSFNNLSVRLESKLNGKKFRWNGRHMSN